MTTLQYRIYDMDRIAVMVRMFPKKSYIIRLKFVAQSRPNRWTDLDESCPIG